MSAATVTQIVSEIKNTLEGEFRRVSVEGEISNLSLSSAGHWYFTLSDKQSSLQCALFRMNTFRNPSLKKLRDGDKVVCFGDIGVYGKRGTFQLIISVIKAKGKGDLKERFELLKKQFASEGLFDMEHKKSIPEFPRAVAVITAQRGAALQDFINIYQRRAARTNLLVVPSPVQGDQAASGIRSAIARVIEYSGKRKIDLIVLTRGGGSFEDLWPFNDEQLIRDIFSCPIPIISAVGHQVDYTLCDFVADKRCETPSAAAEIITTRQMHVKESLVNSKKRLLDYGRILIMDNRTGLQKKHPRIIVDKIWQRFLAGKERLNKCNLSDKVMEVLKLFEKQMRVDEILTRLDNVVDRCLKNNGDKIKGLHELLKAFNPQNVMKRGYSYLKGKNNQVVSGVDEFKKIAVNEALAVHFHDGRGYVKKSR
ncbi:MAG: exodeoxyribonuclease VII large subunit [Halobacteriovoraceae bacterium]|nr:exodeoxyribonuclease VII large subunit [Halobacteriovoraceae bacterium]